MLLIINILTINVCAHIIVSLRDLLTIKLLLKNKISSSYKSYLTPYLNFKIWLIISSGPKKHWLLCHTSKKKSHAKFIIAEILQPIFPSLQVAAGFNLLYLQLWVDCSTKCTTDTFHIIEKLGGGLLKLIFFISQVFEYFNATAHFKNVNNSLNTNIYSFLETSGGQSYNLQITVIHFFNTSVN